MSSQDQEVTEVEEAQLWPSSIEKRFIEVMIEFERVGKMQGSNFPNRVWKEIVEAFNKGVNRKFTEKQMREKFSRLKMNYGIFKRVLEQTGFGWDPIKNTIDAPPDTHPRAKIFQKKGCANYKLLEVLLRKTVATGMLHHASTQSPPNTDDENELEGRFMKGEASKHEEVRDNDDGFFNLKSEPETEVKREDKQSRKGKKRGALEAALLAISEVSLARADRIRSRSNTHDSSCSIGLDTPKSCIAMIKELQLGLDDDTYMKCVEEFKDETTRQLFSALPTPRKRAWVERVRNKV